MSYTVLNEMSLYCLASDAGGALHPLMGAEGWRWSKRHSLWHGQSEEAGAITHHDVHILTAGMGL